MAQRKSNGLVAGAAVMALMALAACSQPSTPAPKAEAPAAATQAKADPAPAAEPIALAITDATGATLSGDPARGRRMFLQCQSCHSLAAGDNRSGPSLNGIVGRPAGSVEGFQYTEANRNSGITWTEQELWAYLENPRGKIPGTNMVFAGIRDGQQRADLIAHLKTAGAAQ